MKLVLTLAALCCTTALAQTTMGPGVRILLGMTDEKPVQWDGSVTARGTQIQSIDGWRFERPDAISGTTWKASTRAPRLFINGLQFDLRGAEVPVVPNGIVVRLSQGD